MRIKRRRMVKWWHRSARISNARGRVALAHTGQVFRQYGDGRGFIHSFMTAIHSKGRLGMQVETVNGGWVITWRKKHS